MQSHSYPFWVKAEHAEARMHKAAEKIFCLMECECPGMVSLLPTIDGRLFRLKGGNRQLAVRLIRAANATLHQGVEVTRIHKRHSGCFDLHYRSSKVDEHGKVGTLAVNIF